MRRARTILIGLLLTPLFFTIAGIGLELWHLRPSSAQEFVQTLRPPNGFFVELVASEPQLAHPIAMTFDERGRLWIVESPTIDGVGRPARPGGLKLLKSSQGNGCFDRVTPIEAGLSMPSAVTVGYGGLWVLDAPDLLFFPLHGDGLGPREVILTGFGKQDTDGLANSLTWGPDGWLYGLNSDYSESRIVHHGKTYDLGCAMFRFHPRTRDFEVFCEGTRNPWGIAFDNEGNAFVSTCVTEHLWLFTETGVYERVGGLNPPFCWQLGPIVDFRHHGHSHCGLHFFDSDVYPPEYREKLYMGNVTFGAVNCDGLERRGAGYRGTPFGDFIGSGSPWFTPVSVKTGPDGLLYVLDWHDRDHCDKDMLRRPRKAPEALGRLYRVRYGEEYRPAGTFDLSRASDEELVQRLRSPNIYFRDMAQRLLAERNTPDGRRRLRELVRDSTAPRKARMHALWALLGGGQLEPDLHLELLDHADAGFRAWGVRAAGNFHRVEPAVREAVVKRASDPAPEVRLQAAIAARKLDGVDPLPLLIRAASTDRPDPLVSVIAWQNLLPLLEQRGEDFLALADKLGPEEAARLAPLRTRAADYLVAHPGQGTGPVVARLQSILEKPDAGTTELREVFVTLSARLASGEFSTAQKTAVQRPALAAVAKILAGPQDAPLYPEAALLGAFLGESKGIALMRERFASNMETPERRLQALGALIAGQDEAILDDVGRLLGDPHASAAFRKPLLAALGGLKSPRVAVVVLEHYPHLEAEVEAQAIELLLQRIGWTKELLRAIAEKKVPSSALNLNQVRPLMASKDAELVKQVTALWGVVREGRNPEREKVVAEMRKYLAQHPGNAAAGKKVFPKLCGQCHKIYGEGADIGPDLTSAGRTAYDLMLTKVFDPNQSVRAGFQAATVYTENGRALTGVLVEDNPRRVVLKLQGGKLEAVPRNQVESVVPSKVTLMPEGIEKLLSPQELADLFAFLTLDRAPDDPQTRKIPGAPP